MSVLSPGTPQAALEVHFDPHKDNEVLKADLRALVSRSGSISLTTEMVKQPFSSTLLTIARLTSTSAARRNENQGQQAHTHTHTQTQPRRGGGGTVLLAPEQPGDVIILEVGKGSNEDDKDNAHTHTHTRTPTATPTTALVVVRGAHVLAREGGVQVGEVTDKSLLRTLMLTPPPVGVGGGGGGSGVSGGGGSVGGSVGTHTPPAVQRYSGNGTCVCVYVCMYI
jgi:hypothetical protein